MVIVTASLPTSERKYIDPMFRFVQDLADSFRLRRPDAHVAARCIKVVQHQMDAKPWADRRRFSMQLTLTFEMAV